MVSGQWAAWFHGSVGRIRKTPLGLRALLLGALLVAPSLAGDVSPVGAQATRTWVSGVGDDANPCSRTAPCKTFAGAISKTATSGEINVLDPGGFGAVTITKSISIISEDIEAGVLVSGTNAIVINAPTTAVVVLRGLDIEGLGTGLNGINFLQGAALYVENCTVNGFTQMGLNAIAPNSEVYVSDSVFRNNLGNTFGGVRVLTSSGTIKAVLKNVQMENNFDGLQVGNSTKVVAIDSVAYGNTNVGFRIFSSIGGALDISRSTASGNGIGIEASQNGQTVVRMEGSIVSGNTTGLTSLGGAQILSGGNNIIAGNNTDGNPTGNIPLR